MILPPSEYMCPCDVCMDKRIAKIEAEQKNRHRALRRSLCWWAAIEKLSVFGRLFHPDAEKRGRWEVLEWYSAKRVATLREAMLEIKLEDAK